MSQSIEERIAECLSNGDDYLNLMECESLTTLPNTIGELTNLERLGLSYSAITTLPDSIGNLTNLKWLDLSSLQITTLPNSIGNLIHLEYLNLMECESLTTLPNTIGELTNLERLDLSCSAITTLPDSIGNLTNLKWLNLSRSQITTLPDWIGNLINLEQLNLLNCESLTTLPDSIGNLKRLFDLRLEGCEALMSVPETIGNLMNWRELDLLKQDASSNVLSFLSSGHGPFADYEMKEKYIFLNEDNEHIVFSDVLFTTIEDCYFTHLLPHLKKHFETLNVDELSEFLESRVVVSELDELSKHIAGTAGFYYYVEHQKFPFMKRIATVLNTDPDYQQEIWEADLESLKTFGWKCRRPFYLLAWFDVSFHPHGNSNTLIDQSLIVKRRKQIAVDVYGRICDNGEFDVHCGLSDKYMLVKRKGW